MRLDIFTGWENPERDDVPVCDEVILAVAAPDKTGCRAQRGIVEELLNRSRGQRKLVHARHSLSTE